MCPELERAGGLANALDFEFKKMNSALRVTLDEVYNKIPVTYARIENGHKFSQIYIAAEEKLYLPDFWRDGVCLAHGSTASLQELAQVVDHWLTQNISTQELSDRFNLVQPGSNAKAFDESNDVEHTWKYLLSDDDSLGLKEFISLASKDELLNKLFPLPAYILYALVNVQASRLTPLTYLT